jgi:hypothetical protein
MSTTNTPNIVLVKPDVGTKEPYNQSTVNSNWDKVDAAFGESPSKVTTTTVQNTTSETSLMLWTIAANNANPGSTYHLTVFGTADITGTPTGTFRVKLGGTTLLTLAVTCAANTNRPWCVRADLECITTGGSGTWRVTARLEDRMAAAEHWTMDTSATATTKDTTVGQGFEVSFQWSVASASNVCRADGGYARRMTNL